LIFNKVALEWDQEKFSGAALSGLIHYPDTQGVKAKIKEVKLLGFLSQTNTRQINNTLFALDS
jgi:hypothetical protein